MAERRVEAMPEFLPALETPMRIHDLQERPEDAEMVARQIAAIEPGRLAGEQRIVEALLQRDPPAAIACVQSLMDGLPERDRTVLRPWLAQVQDRAGERAAALSTWLEFHAEQAQHRLPLPPHATPQPAQWPAPGEVDAANRARPLLLRGAPRLAGRTPGQCHRRGQRRAAARPLRPAGAGRRAAELPHGARPGQRPAVAGAGRGSWKQALPARGINDGNVIDWLLWWDNSLLLALRPYLPEGRLAIVLRDPRDMLMDWLAFGATVPLAVHSADEAARWLAESLSQVATLHEQDLYPHKLLRLDGHEDNPEAAAHLLGEAFAHRSRCCLRSARRASPAGHWRLYGELLATEIALLTPVACAPWLRGPNDVLANGDACMRLTTESFNNGQPIPAEFAMGVPTGFGGNRNPQLAWHRRAGRDAILRAGVHRPGRADGTRAGRPQGCRSAAGPAAQ